MNNSIKLLILDVDGVLTDGKVYLLPNGYELKSFHVQDGLGIKRCQQAGITVAVITGRKSEAVTKRMKELSIEHYFQGIHDKEATLKALLESLDIEAKQCACVGDDLPDLAIMQHVGLKLAVANAVPEVLEQADWIASRNGGEGAVREICDYLLSRDND